MRTAGLNIFILSENALVVSGLRNYLSSRFNNAVSVHSFYDVKSMVKKVDFNTDVVIVDYLVEGQNGGEIIKAVKALAPDATGIYHTSQEEVAQRIESLLLGERTLVQTSVAFTLNPRFTQTYARR